MIVLSVHSWLLLLVNLLFFFFKACNRCVYTKEPVVLLNMPPYYKKGFVELLMTRSSQKGFLISDKYEKESKASELPRLPRFLCNNMYVLGALQAVRLS